MSPKEIIERQVKAYNERNLSEFVACHHSAVELYNFSESVPFAVGASRIKEIYQEVFESSPNLNTEIIKRMVMGNTVIDHEIVTGRKGVDRLEIIAIYEVENDLIVKAHFIRK